MVEDFLKAHSNSRIPVVTLSAEFLFGARRAVTVRSALIEIHTQSTQGQPIRFRFQRVNIVVVVSVPFLLGYQSMKERNIIPLPKDDGIFFPNLSLSIQRIIIQGHLCFPSVNSVWYNRAELQLVHRQFAHKPIHQLVRHFPKGTFSRDDVKMLTEI